MPSRHGIEPWIGGLLACGVAWASWSALAHGARRREHLHARGAYVAREDVVALLDEADLQRFSFKASGSEGSAVAWVAALLACIMAVRDGVIAPTIGYQEPDPECALDVVPNVAREADVNVALSNAFAFGGLNAVLALKRV